VVSMRARARTVLPWSGWLAPFGCCAAGVLVTLAVTRPLTSPCWPGRRLRLGLSARRFHRWAGARPAAGRPIRSAGCTGPPTGWSLTIPLEPWVAQLVCDRRSLPLAAKVAYVVLAALRGHRRSPAASLSRSYCSRTGGCARGGGARWRRLAWCSRWWPAAWRRSPPEEALFPQPAGAGRRGR
jgi:hypothetical protein